MAVAIAAVCDVMEVRRYAYTPLIFYREKPKNTLIFSRLSRAGNWICWIRQNERCIWWNYVFELYVCCESDPRTKVLKNKIWSLKQDQKEPPKTLLEARRKTKSGRWWVAYTCRKVARVWACMEAHSVFGCHEILGFGWLWVSCFDSWGGDAISTMQSKKTKWTVRTMEEKG